MFDSVPSRFQIFHSIVGVRFGFVAAVEAHETRFLLHETECFHHRSTAAYVDEVDRADSGHSFWYAQSEAW